MLRYYLISNVNNLLIAHCITGVAWQIAQIQKRIFSHEPLLASIHEASFGFHCQVFEISASEISTLEVKVNSFVLLKR